MSQCGSVLPSGSTTKRLLFMAGVICLVVTVLRPQSSNDLLYTEARSFDGEAWLRAGERFPSGARIILQSGGDKRPLVTGFDATADPELSFDAKNVLFAGRKLPREPWSIWEVPLEGGMPKPLTSGDSDCVRPFYLPEGRFVYARKTRGAFQIESAPLAAGAPLRLTYAPGNAMPSQVLADGRILFAAAFPMGASGPTDLYTVYSDGSGMEAVRCDHGKARSDARQLASGDIVFRSASGFGRFTSSRARQIDLDAAPPAGAGPIAEFDAGEWLISMKPPGQAGLGLYRWSPTAPGKPIMLVAAASSVVQPVPVRPRETPLRFPSGLHEWQGANLLCLNAYESPLRFEDNSIATVRLYSRSASGAPVLLGQTEVESDGSYFLHVPSDRPLRFELADRAGHVLQAEKGWFWMRRGEQRVCVGCHAGPTRAPGNAVPKILSKAGVPIPLLGAGGEK